jgi:hypothetical protein
LHSVVSGERGGFTLGLGLLNPYPSLNVAGKMAVMFRLFNKKGQAVKNWRSRAMLIDLHKTKVTISYST